MIVLCDQYCDVINVNMPQYAIHVSSNRCRIAMEERERERVCVCVCVCACVFVCVYIHIYKYAGRNGGGLRPKP